MSNGKNELRETVLQTVSFPEFCKHQARYRVCFYAVFGDFPEIIKATEETTNINLTEKEFFIYDCVRANDYSILLVAQKLMNGGILGHHTTEVKE